MKKSNTHYPFLLFLFLFISFTAPLASQPTTPSKVFFEEEPTQFLKQLNNFVTLNKREDCQKAMDQFERTYRNNVFNAEDLKRIVKVTNQMREVNIPAYPSFLDYLTALNVFAAPDKKSRFNAWHGIVEKMLTDVKNRKFEPVTKFLDFSADFLATNELNKGLGGLTTWSMSNRDYEFLYENNVPSVKWAKVSLIGNVKKDSISVLETTGRFFPLLQSWKGNGGIVYWDRNGKNKNVYATLSDYEIIVTKSAYSAPNVKLHYAAFFANDEVVGDLEDRLQVASGNQDATYPRFQSKEKVLQINDIGEGWKYEGGFKLQGNTFSGFGTPELKAKLTYKDDKKGQTFRASAEQFTIRKGETVASDRTEIILLLGKDSIYHPSVNVKIDLPKGEVLLERGQRGSDRNPFINSYHRVMMDINRLKWYLKSDSVVLGDRLIGYQANENKATFESSNFYTENDYVKVQNISTVNPIAEMKRLADEQNRKILKADEIAKKMSAKMSASSIQTLLFELVAQGFIKYDPDKQLVELLDKVYLYESAKQKKTDYDVIRVYSESPKENGSFSLRDTTITLNGVKAIELSQRQKVALRPMDERIKFKQNRDIDFDGKLFAGYNIFQGYQFHFDYSPFVIRLDSCRFLDLYLKPFEDKLAKAKAINSAIEYLTGTVYIDRADNKSGVKENALYPQFQSRASSYVYYDMPTNQQGIYKRDSFFFRLDPFRLDGLDSLTKNDLKFKGLFVSNDIFPPFQEVLTLQPDSSLGFITRNVDGGYPIYRGKGNFKGDITLNNSGLLGGGLLKYLDADINSSDFIFKPKQMLASAQKFELKERRTGENQVPEIFGPAVKIDWRPYSDSMYIYAGEQAFKMFKAGNYTMRSTLILTPSGVKGKGVFDWEKGTLNANLFSFGPYSVQSDTMNMSIRALSTGGGEQLAFDTKNISGKIDFDEQIGRFKANSADIQTSMPYVKYKTSINDFAWDLSKENITFKSTGEDAQFLCVDPNQDSLRFFGKTASYDLRANVLKVGGAGVIQTCDAYVYPNEENVEIKSGGLMTTLENARIICDTVNRHHVINRATVNISGRKGYSAQGFYEYNVGNRQQEIKFDNIVGTRVGAGSRSEKKTETRATGEVKLEDDFRIDYKTAFKGKISLFANSRNLNFDGFAKLDASSLVDQQWFSINSDADKSDLSLSYNVPKNERGEPLQTGLFISKEAAVLYPRVMMPLYLRKDRVIIDAKGVFKYYPKTDEFVFGDSLKILKGEQRGNKLVLGNKYGSVNAEGKMNICSSLTYAKVTAAGRARTQFLSKEESEMASSRDSNKINVGVAKTTADIFAFIDMLIPDRLIKLVAADFQVGSFDAPDNEYNKDDFTDKALAEFITEPKDFQKIVDKVREKTLELPEKYTKNANFIFPRIPVRWDKDEQAFITTGKKIDVHSIAGLQLNKQLTGFVMFKMPSNEDDRVYVYLKSANDYVYFFGYQRGVLEITTNNQRVEEEFKKMKPKEKILKMADGETVEVQWADYGRAEIFARRITAAASKQ
ncbi:MAG: hypothetical protein RL757_1090 [Bacteroidota bacterium]|jgi:hypothetical protein